ncbi:MAG TPA: MBL fold metallo-hydrolase [Solirubrobacteraceae bacterium]|nr:MBL fold metallo-hydrolase [Solirubrobacteraceae bacterium]
MEEIAQGIHGITSPLGEREFTQVVLAGADRTVLIDTGVAATPREVIAPALEEAGIAEPQLIVISHADLDHSGGNRDALELWPDAHIATHELDRDWVASNDAMLAGNYLWYRELGFEMTDEDRDGMAEQLGGDAPVDGVVSDGDVLGLGDGWEVEIVHLPGHTPGHVGVWDARSRTAIVVDAVLGRGIRDNDGNLVIPPRVYDTQAYRKTIERLRGLQPEQLVTGHFGTLRGDDVTRFLDDSLAHDEDLERLVREAADAGEHDVKAIVERADAQLGPFADAPHELAAAVRDHLRAALT